MFPVSKPMVFEHISIKGRRIRTDRILDYKTSRANRFRDPEAPT